ncbi:hypothetical protein PF001_g19094 [Phytophthora fragariae]|uniref:Uncharacterized protein n=2 Tax=Phytophthora fragariae TaxID=53985 RepID=A0A6A4CLQ2_9STRA|nr:hypothetical protein PF001_g19094 [Phytophthora fragariae]
MQTEDEWVVAVQRFAETSPVELPEEGTLAEMRAATKEAKRFRVCITVDALLVEGQSDELLIGEDWMVERQVKMDFGDHELKYHDEGGQNVILPFTCHGVSMLQQAGQRRMVVVRLAKTVNLATNTRSVVQMGEMVSIVVRGGRREKLPAREALATWILTDNDMQILTPNGELERTRVAKAPVVGSSGPDDDSLSRSEEVAAPPRSPRTSRGNEEVRSATIASNSTPAELANVGRESPATTELSRVASTLQHLTEMMAQLQRAPTAERQAGPATGTQLTMIMTAIQQLAAMITDLQSTSIGTTSAAQPTRRRADTAHGTSRT